MSTQTAEPAAKPAGGPSGGVDTALVELIRLLRQLDRPDLVDRATAAAARLKRPATIVCVVGEFKQGKSSLVNGLLGHPICPVDDDLATSAITLVRYGEKASAVVRRRVNDEQVAEPIQINELSEWVSEQGNPKNHKGVERVELAVPSAILKQGLVIVDTPGMGGLGAGHAAATLAFLPFADGLVLVSDASAELSAPEVDFLQRATELCPTVMFAQTKTDLYPAWERIYDLNKGHLESRGIRIPSVAVSANLRTEALSRKDKQLNATSRFPELIKVLGDGVVKPAKESAADRSAADVRGIITLVRSGLEDEKRLLADPSQLEGAIADINRAKERLEHLRGPGARWTVLLSDRVADLSTKVIHHLRGGMRAASREMDNRIEALKKGSEWDDVARDLQTAVADHVTVAFLAVEEGRSAIRAEVAELLQEEHLSLHPAREAAAGRFDVSELWQDKSIDDEAGAKAMFKTGILGARGAQGGVLMFGMMGNFLPGAVATLMASNPVLLGAGAIFGGMQLMEDRKRKVTMRRQTARQQVRQFVDDVQFEVTNEVTTLVRDVQRELRDEFTERLGELQRTYTETAQRAQADAKRSQEDMKARAAQLGESLTKLAAVEQLVQGASQ